MDVISAACAARDESTAGNWPEDGGGLELTRIWQAGWPAGHGPTPEVATARSANQSDRVSAVGGAAVQFSLSIFGHAGRASQ
jgi:hypothetical protein